MLRSVRVLAAVIALGAVLACGADTSKSAKPTSPAPDAKQVDPATAGNITGKVLLDGAAPAPTVIKTASDPVCADVNKGDLKSETFVVDNGGLENAFVYLKDGLGNKYIFDVPTEPVKLDQHGCRYIPHVLGVRVAQPLEIVNSDSTLHNVHGRPEANREFNFGEPVPGFKQSVTFTVPEVLIPFKCDVHSWMYAYLGVVDHPYFAVTADGGKFELKSIPPGTYTIEAVHEKLGKQTQSVTLGEKDSKEITFTFKVPA
jgi:hypothetical protein